MQSKNAIKNLKNRYMSVLNKCKLLNTFGSLLVASAFVLGASPALAADVTVGNLQAFTDALNPTITPNLDDILVNNIIQFNAPASYANNANDIDVKARPGYIRDFATISNNTSFTNFDFEGFSTVFYVASGSLTLTDSNFSDYTVAGITNNGTLTINATNDDVEFESNVANATAITNNATLNLNTSANREIEFGNAVSHSVGLLTIDGNVEFNKGLTGGGNLTMHNGLVKFSSDVTNIGTFTANGGSVTMQDNAINKMEINELVGTLNLSIDVDGASKTSDTISLTNSSGIVNIQDINMITPTNETSIVINPFSDKTPTTVDYKGGNVLSPLYTYSVSADSGNITLTRTNNVNKTVQANAVAVSNASTSQFNTNTKAFTRVNRIMNLSSDVRAEYINNLYASNDASALSIEARPSTQGVWIDPYFSIETISPDNADDFDYTSYGFAGGYDSSFHKLGNLDAVYGAYLAFNMGNAEYTQNDLSQMEVSLGGSATFIMDNLYFGATANLGYGSNEIENKDTLNTYYGNSDYSTINAGVALLAGYNIEFSEGKFIVQPNAMLSYARIGEADYTAKGGFKVEMEAINAFEFVPAVRAIMNLENNMQVYADASVAIALNNEAIVKVAGIEAPEINQGVYSEIGLGVQKDWTSFSLYGEANGKLGSRQGFGANAGFKYYF